MMESLMTLCHYCLLDNVSPVSIGQQVPSSIIRTELLQDLQKISLTSSMCLILLQEYVG
ncbi:hypothetical protein DPMN_043663 [Dreissena polymorpha]|uniref:Uncharacterized protein n=1 Tax=Dreissena polymorpha TaxID=45954 RepID=A0A9D4D1H4_DREPO|nr:hypothetical protein DPMN_043663 [Dreissena polymorpha]